jgi:hypothetical protein
MESAASRFFNITELAHHLILLLDLEGISRMTQTCRHLNALYTPALYYDIEATYKYNRRQIFSSRDSIKALARNTHHVRQLTLQAHEAAYYANCIFAYQDEALSQVTTDTTANGHPPQRRFFQGKQPLRPASPDPRDCPVFPIPPMTLLTKLKINADLPSLAEKCPYFLPSFKDPKATFTHICWIMDLNPNLLDVSLERVIVKDQRDIRLLATSIFGLKNLQILRLELYQRDNWEMPSDLVPALFFSCPASLRSLNLSLVEEGSCWEEPIFDEYLNTVQGELQPWEKDEVECQVPAVMPQRQEPLVCMTRLELSDARDVGMTESQFLSMLAHCPNLTHLAIPKQTGIKDVDHLAEEIAQLCPKLSSVRNANSQGHLTQRLVVEMLRTLPHQQVKMLHCRSSRKSSDPHLYDSGSVFLRHSSTLQSIVLSGCQFVNSETIKVILIECGALEELSVSWRRSNTRQQLCIDLRDAIEFPWVCTRIRSIVLTVAIPDEPFYHLAKDTMPYYERPAPILLSTAERKQLQSLEALYRQIGVLTELRTLDLQAVFYDPQDRRSLSKFYLNTTFPGMLSLGCEETNRPGFLHHLAGLTKLEKLLGSVSAKTKESKATVGVREARWMKHHWPMLEGVSALRG